MTCTSTGAAPIAESGACGGGGTLRTDGDSNFPCLMRSRPTRDSFICDLPLRSGAVLNSITLHGIDSSATGYFEGAVFRTADATFAPEYFGNFGGTWQSSGLAATPGTVTVPILSGANHVVAAGYRYTIGIGTKDSTSGTLVFGAHVTYTIP
ncbi:MAG: hypothetical protein JNK56_39260 [Myxococcales bacterium]|nr:hypothetical protein [Myxococcales bacterium]